MERANRATGRLPLLALGRCRIAFVDEAVQRVAVELRLVLLVVAVVDGDELVAIDLRRRVVELHAVRVREPPRYTSWWSGGEH